MEVEKVEASKVLVGCRLEVLKVDTGNIVVLLQKGLEFIRLADWNEAYLVFSLGHQWRVCGDGQSPLTLGGTYHLLDHMRACKESIIHDWREQKSFLLTWEADFKSTELDDFEECLRTLLALHLLLFRDPGIELRLSNSGWSFANQQSQFASAGGWDGLLNDILQQYKERCGGKK